MPDEQAQLYSKKSLDDLAGPAEMIGELLGNGKYAAAAIVAGHMVKKGYQAEPLHAVLALYIAGEIDGLSKDKSQKDQPQISSQRLDVLQRLMDYHVDQAGDYLKGDKSKS